MALLFSPCPRRLDESRQTITLENYLTSATILSLDITNDMSQRVRGQKLINISLFFSFGSGDGGGEGQLLRFSIKVCKERGVRERAGTITAVHEKRVSVV